MTRVLEETRPKASKHHTCSNCDGRIGCGDEYLNQVNVSDGTLYTYKSHILCHALWLDAYWEYNLEDDDWGFEHAWGAVAEWWRSLCTWTQGELAPQ